MEIYQYLQFELCSLDEIKGYLVDPVVVAETKRNNNPYPSRKFFDNTRYTKGSILGSGAVNCLTGAIFCEKGLVVFHDTPGHIVNSGFNLPNGDIIGGFCGGGESTYRAYGEYYPEEVKYICHPVPQRGYEIIDYSFAFAILFQAKLVVCGYYLNPQGMYSGDAWLYD